MAQLWENLRNPVVLAAFEGWNDAADSATQAIEHLAQTYPTDFVWALDSEDYYDFQMTRPCIEKVTDKKLPGDDDADGYYEVKWPQTKLSVIHLPRRDVVAVLGPEPNFRWHSYCSALMSAFKSINPAMVIVLGAMLTDAPHSRPLPVSGSATDPRVIADIGIETSDYEGPIGIVGVLTDVVRKANIECVTLWAAVPHYVSSSPNPKATLALLTRIEDLLDEAIDLGGLPDSVDAWQRGVDELAEEDPEVSEYIQELEQQIDSEELPSSAGNALAADFMRYLRHQQNR